MRFLETMTEGSLRGESDLTIKPLKDQIEWGPDSLDLAMRRLVTLVRAILEQRWGRKSDCNGFNRERGREIEDS